MQKDGNRMDSVLSSKRKQASEMLKNYCVEHCERKQSHVFSAYTDVLELNIFQCEAVAAMLYSISDESYSYFTNGLFSIPDHCRLLNLFSGSGRLIKEIYNHGLSQKFISIQSVDKSKIMINFQKRNFDGLLYAPVSFITSDVFDLSPDDVKNNIAVCHCGLRYINPRKYSKLLDIMLSSKINSESLSIISEFSNDFINLFRESLIKKAVSHKVDELLVTVQKNTTLYYAYIYYCSEKTFRLLVRDLALMEGLSEYEILKELAGYKKVKITTLIF